MAFTVEDFRDLVRILDEKPEWRAELRRLVLTGELLSLPEQVAGFRAETEKGFQELTAEVTRLSVEVTRLGGEVTRLSVEVTRLGGEVTRLSVEVTRLGGEVTRLSEELSSLAAEVKDLTRTTKRLVIDVAELKGDSLERRYRERAPAYFGGRLRRPRALSSEDLDELLESSIERGLLGESEAADVRRSDLVVRGRRRDGGNEVYLVVEVSSGVGAGDVERALRRAQILSRSGVAALPAVAGTWITPEASRAAAENSVWQFTDGTAQAPESGPE